jgi:hypothetical protein
MIRVGVTGHRFLAELDRVEVGVELALKAIEKAWPGEHLTVLSALAEGADRLVAQTVLARSDARLVAVLPLAKDDYMTDFGSPESKSEFVAFLDRAVSVVEGDGAATREEAYEACGRSILEQCDVLLAVWDGQDAQGQAGTGRIVALAREQGLPVAWVHAGNRRPGTNEPTSLGDEQGRVTFERFDRP